MNFLILSSRFLFKFYKKNLENLFGEIFNEIIIELIFLIGY